MPTVYKKLVPAFGTAYNNMGGTLSLAHWSPVGDFLVLQPLPPSPTNPEDAYEIVTAHTFKTGFCFLEIYTSHTKGQSVWEPVGEEDGGGWKATATLFIPGDGKEMTFMANRIRSDWGIFLIPDADGTINQIGTAKHKPFVKMGKDTGLISGGGKGYTMTIECYQPDKVLYKAAVTIVPAT